MTDKWKFQCHLYQIDAGIDFVTKAARQQNCNFKVGTQTVVAVYNGCSILEVQFEGIID